MPSRDAIEFAITATIDKLRQAGDSWWSGAEMAPIIFRRWTSFSRRNRSKKPNREHRVLDLIKGLQAHFEPEIPYTHTDDWRRLAIVICDILDQFDES